TAGATHSFTVTAKDSFGNVASGYTGTVGFNSSDSQATFAPTPYTFTSTDAGVHAYNPTPKTSCTSQPVTASDGTFTARQRGIVVNPAQTSSLTLHDALPISTAGATHSFTVTAKDSFGNVARGYTGTVTFTSSDSQATFAPTPYTFSSTD